MFIIVMNYLLRFVAMRLSLLPCETVCFLERISLGCVVGVAGNRQLVYYQ